MSVATKPIAVLDAPVRDLLEQIAGPAAASTPDLAAIGAALAELAADVDYLSRWVQDLGDESGLRKMYAPERGPRLQIVHRRDGEMGAVHDHHTWVAISSITGLEAHRRYRVTGSGASARPERIEELTLAPRDAVTMLPPNDLHDHGHIAGRGRPAHVLILTGDDQMLFERNEWDLVTGRHRILRPGDRGRWLASDPMPPA